MKKIILTFIISLLSIGEAWSTTESFVTIPGDTEAAGTLRSVLRKACNKEGDDIITFHEQLSDTRFELNEPLVIPQDCNGTVVIRGLASSEVILDAAIMSKRGTSPGDTCTLYVYSDGNTVENMTFLGNDRGAGVCLFGRRNTVENCRFGETGTGESSPNRHGVVISDIYVEEYPDMDGGQASVIGSRIGPGSLNGLWIHADDAQIRENEIFESDQTGILASGNGLQISSNHILRNGGNGMHLEGNDLSVEENEISGNGRHGIWIRSQNTTIQKNVIKANGGCPEEEPYLSQDFDCWLPSTAAGAGIKVADGSSQIAIGGNEFEEEANLIQYNAQGGIFVADDTENILVTHNIISKNYGVALPIDLGIDGITPNDKGDGDSGANTLINHIDYFQVFPLVPDLDGNERYWGWGFTESGERGEIYQVSEEEIEREIEYGGADHFLGDATISVPFFEASPEALTGLEEGWVTVGSQDENGNTSEFSHNIAVGLDEDADGIPDFLEVNDSEWNPTTSAGTLKSTTDTDGDGLPDSVEDKNRNGKWDEDLGETNGNTADSDGDGLSDWAEVHGDGDYNPLVDTNPLLPDTDGDGIADGREDSDNNGIRDGYLGETNPLSTDSDGDGFNDASDTCPTLFNPGQEARYCR